MANSRRPNGYWNLETLLQSSKAFNTVSEWSKADMGAYLASRKLGLFNEVTKHMLSHPESISKSRTIWTKEVCLESAKKYNKRFDWEKEDNKAYAASKKHGWYDECVSHMILGKKPNNYWTFERCIEEARKHKTITEWINSNAASYQSAKSNEVLFQKCTSHMERMWERKWTVELILKESKKYLTKQEWIKSSPQSYDAALKRRIVKTASKHMIENPKWFGVSTIHKFLKSYDIEYEDEKTYEDCRDKRKLPFDFFLPKFNLLIEHHGTQHQRGWQGKGSEQIQKRDLIKKTYAKNNQINFLEINEWELNSSQEIEKIIIQKIISVQPNYFFQKRELTEKEIKQSTTKLKFSLEELKEISQTYKTRVAFKRGNESAYNFACRHKLINDVCIHMISKSESQRIGLTKWTKDKVIESAKKYSNASEWSRNEGSAYNSARRNGWLEEVSKYYSANSI